MKKKFLDNNYLIAVLVIVASIGLLLFSNVFLSTAFKIFNSIGHKSSETNYFSINDLLNFQFKYKTYYLIVSAVIFISDVRIIYTMKTSFKNINQGQKGTCEFTTLKELKEQYKAVPEKTETYKGGGGVVISRYKDKIFIDDSPVNNLIIGISRSGKGETFVFPTIDVYSRAEKKPSMIINDPKGELASASYDTLKSRGYDIQILNLIDPDSGMSYNPLQLIIDAYKNKDYSTAQLLCNTLTFSLYNDPTSKDKYFNESAQFLVNALILAITKDCLESEQEEKITLYTIANFLSEMGSKKDEDGNNELDKFFQRRDASDIAKMQYATSNFAAGTTRGGIFSTAMGKLQIFTFDKIARMTAKNSYDLEKVGFGEKPVAVFMVTPDYDSSNHVIASVFVRQTYFILSQKATFSKGRKCKREVVYLLDEVGNMPAIQDLKNIITVCLGRNIRFNLIIQAYSQLEDLYGKATYKTILNNCGNTIYILTSDYDTAKKVSDEIGYKTQVNSSLSGRSLSFNKSTTQSVDRQALLDPNQLKSLMEGESVVIRVIKRKDNQGNKIKAKPIYNTGETSLKFRYEYLSEEFNTDIDLNDIDIESKHKDIDITKLLITSNENNKLDAEKEVREEISNDKVDEKEMKELTKQEKFKIQKITKKYEDLEDIDILNSSDNDIKEMILEYKNYFSDEDKNDIEKILEVS